MATNLVLVLPSSVSNEQLVDAICAVADWRTDELVVNTVGTENLFENKHNTFCAHVDGSSAGQLLQDCFLVETADANLLFSGNVSTNPRVLLARSTPSNVAIATKLLSWAGGGLVYNNEATEYLPVQGQGQLSLVFDVSVPVRVKRTAPTHLTYEDFLEGGVHAAYGFASLGGLHVALSEEDAHRARAEFVVSMGHGQAIEKSSDEYVLVV